MKLYHGTNIDFSEIDFKKCKPNKDFGRGVVFDNLESSLGVFPLLLGDVEFIFEGSYAVFKIFDIDNLAVLTFQCIHQGG